MIPGTIPNCWPTISHDTSPRPSPSSAARGIRSFVRSFEKCDKGTTGETKRRIQEKFEISVSLSYARTGTHLLLVNSSPGKEGRRVCWKRGLEKKREIRSPFFVQHLNNSLRHAVYANLLRR